MALASDTLDECIETDLVPALAYRFRTYESITRASGELRKHGVRINADAQPFQVLLMLWAIRPLLTREEISRDLVARRDSIDFDHGVNSPRVNRIREALGDTASNPRFVETWPSRLSLRAPVENAIPSQEDLVPDYIRTSSNGQAAIPAESGTNPRFRILASPQELPKAPTPVVQNALHPFAVHVSGLLIGACGKSCRD